MMRVWKDKKKASKERYKQIKTTTTAKGRRANWVTFGSNFYFRFQVPRYRLITFKIWENFLGKIKV